MNVAIVVIDTLRYDHVSANGNPDVRTPNLDRLAAESWRFDHCFAASFPTIPHRLDFMSGGYGAPFHAWMPLPYDWPTLPETLAEEGYATQLIHDTPHLVNGGHHFDWPFHAWTFVRGAEVDRPWIGDLSWPDNWAQDELWDFADTGPAGYNPFPTYIRANRARKRLDDWNAARLFGAAADFLHENQRRDNFLLWVDCFDPHEPWDAPPEFVRMYDRRPGYDGRIDPRSFVLRNDEGLTDEAADHLRAQYAAKVTWMDRCFGRFLDTFHQTDLAENTALLLTSDHGTRLGEFGRFGKGGRIQEQISRVPLFIRPPGGEHGVCEALAQPQDFWPTLAALAGIDAPETPGTQDLLAVARGRRKPVRDVALAGGSADGWPRGAGGPLFTVFAADDYLELALEPENSRLHRYGDGDDDPEHMPDRVQALHAAGLNELERRGTEEALIRWLRDGGETGLPDDTPLFRGWPKPAGYRPYFQRLYHGE